MLQNASSRVASVLASPIIGNFAKRVIVSVRAPWQIRGDPGRPSESAEVTILRRVPSLRRGLESLLTIPDVQANLLGLARTSDLPALPVGAEAFVNLSDEDARAVANAVSNVPVALFNAEIS